MSQRGPRSAAVLLTCLAVAAALVIVGTAPGSAGTESRTAGHRTGLGYADRPAAPARLVEIKIPDRRHEIPSRWIRSYDGAPRARVLLPAGYDPRRRYSLMVLLNGLSGVYSDWSTAGLGTITKTADGFDGIIVMPEGGSGWYTDWWNDGHRGNPSWESYIIDQVVPQVLERFSIREGRRWHALVGLSMGGMGAAYLGGRMAGFFGSVAIISGLVDMHLYPLQGAAVSLIPQSEVGATPDPDAVMGPAQGFYSQAHDPMRLAGNLRRTRVFMTVGNGVPTSDGLPTATSTYAREIAFESAIIRPASDNYADILRAAGVDLTYRTHNGAHDWPNARQGLRDAIRWGLFKPVAEAPQSWTHDTVATRGPLWDLRFDFTSPPTRVVRFRRTGRHLRIGAAGSGVVITTPSGCRIPIRTPAVIQPWAAHCR